MGGGDKYPMGDRDRYPVERPGSGDRDRYPIGMPGDRYPSDRIPERYPSDRIPERYPSDRIPERYPSDRIPGMPDRYPVGGDRIPVDRYPNYERPSGYPPVYDNRLPGDDRYTPDRRYPDERPSRYPDDRPSRYPVRPERPIEMYPDTRYPPDRRYPVTDSRYPEREYTSGGGRIPPVIPGERYPVDDRRPVIPGDQMSGRYPDGQSGRYPSMGESGRYPVSDNRFPVGNDRNPLFIYKYGNRDRLPSTSPGNNLSLSKQMSLLMLLCCNYNLLHIFLLLGYERYPMAPFDRDRGYVDRYGGSMYGSTDQVCL